MATTIARLAAVLSMDTAAFSAACQKAGVSVHDLKVKTTNSDKALGKFGQQLAKFGGAFSAFGGLAGAAGNVAGGFGIAGAAAGGFILKLAQMADKAREAREELAGLTTSKDIQTNFDKQLGILGEESGLTTNALKEGFAKWFEMGNIASGAEGRAHLKDIIASEMAQQAELSKKKLEDIIDAMKSDPEHFFAGRDMGLMKKQFTGNDTVLKAINEAEAKFANWTQKFNQEWSANVSRQTEELNQWQRTFNENWAGNVTRQTEELNEWQRTFHQEWGENVARQTEELREAARDIQKEFGTPSQKFEIDLKRLEELRKAAPDIVTPEVFKRAIKDAKANALKSDELKPLKLAGGADRFTAAGFSQVMQGTASRAQQIKADPQQLAVEKAARDALLRMEKKPPIKFHVVHFN